MEPTLSFFLSPGRTGTQWIGDRLARHYSDLAVVEHEPIHADYAPRRALRAADRDLLASTIPVVASQLRHIETVVASGRRYIEAGWCVFAWMPWFIARYPGRVRLVHFTRHPVRFAYSTESHAFYQPELRDDGYTRNAQLEPTDTGVRYPAYRQRWAAMCPFEKCLYQWLEVNAYILELPRLHPDVPYLHMRMEDLTADKPGSWNTLLGFLELPIERLPADPERQERVDQFQFLIDRVADPALVQHHPEVMEMARALGYDPLAVDRQAAAPLPAIPGTTGGAQPGAAADGPLLQPDPSAHGGVAAGAPKRGSIPVNGAAAELSASDADSLPVHAAQVLCARRCFFGSVCVMARRRGQRANT